MKADSIYSTGQLLFYKHSTTQGTSGAPLLLLDKNSTPTNPKYSVIGVHVADSKEAEINIGVLLHSLSLAE
jgi:V8-like Glu-specific endopeptidase